jgi:hypothetical protein
MVYLPNLVPGKLRGEARGAAFHDVRGECYYSGSEMNTNTCVRQWRSL